MGNIFAGSEIVEIGIQIEKNGRDFYNTLAKKTRLTHAKDIFEYLAGEEEKHISVFKKILDNTQQYQPQGLDSQDYFAYMRSLAGEYVFTRPDQGAQIARKTTGDKQALDMGIGFEKDSIVFYEGMNKMVSPGDKKVVDEIIVQEQDHLRQLTELKKTVIN